MSNGTVKVKPWGHNQGEFVIIDQSEFDPEKHELFEPAPAEAAEKPAKAKK